MFSPHIFWNQEISDHFRHSAAIKKYLPTARGVYHGFDRLLAMPVLISLGYFRTSHLTEIPMFRREFISYSLLLIFFFAHHFYLLPRLYFTHRYIANDFSILACYLFISFFPWIVEPNSLIPDTILAHIPPGLREEQAFIFPKKSILNFNNLCNTQYFVLQSTIQCLYLYTVIKFHRFIQHIRSYRRV